MPAHGSTKFRHLGQSSTGRNSTNNILALAFGVFVVGLVVFGSIIIMVNLDANM